ncbi:MAG: hypothetical protein COA79_18430 [Planctomycetota bacterium]|nr:MAG: hypothetical protein COA79_18430 [Planctomycetota bacterium]
MKILLVDDEKNFSDVLDSYLHFDHEVTVYNNSLNALEHYKKNQDYQVIITDYLMPYLRGDELIRDILKINKKQQFIISSGYFSDRSLGVFEKEGQTCYVIKKPYDLDHMGVLLELLE